MSITDTLISALRLIFNFRRLIHSIAYFGAMMVAIASFGFVLMLAESVVYYISGQPVSLWAMVIAAVTTVFGYGPLVQAMQRALDRVFFPHQLDTLAAIRQLGAGDLAQLPIQDVEIALLERICKVCYRSRAALDERGLPGGRWYSYPADAPEIDAEHAQEEHEGYDVCLKLPAASGEAYLWLGPRMDGWPMDAEERESLESLARFSSMSLEHARLTHQQEVEARLDSLSRVTRQLHSHDLKNRLHDLSFLAHHLGSGKLDKEDIQRMLAAIVKVTGRMQTLMQRMNDPNAPLELKLSPVDLPYLLQTSIRERLWPESIRLEAHYESVPAMAGDADQLQGVFENLYDNAVQAMNRVGALCVDVTMVEVEGTPMVETRIRDEGCGMSEEFLQKRLFRLFATSKANGLGVGLYLSRRIVEAHGGTIAAESEGVDKGSSFIVRLPLWQHRNERSAKESAA